MLHPHSDCVVGSSLELRSLRTTTIGEGKHRWQWSNHCLKAFRLQPVEHTVMGIAEALRLRQQVKQHSFLHRTSKRMHFFTETAALAARQVPHKVHSVRNAILELTWQAKDGGYLLRIHGDRTNGPRRRPRVVSRYSSRASRRLNTQDSRKHPLVLGRLFNRLV